MDVLGGDVSKHLLVLGVSVVGELVVTSGPGGTSGVVLLNPVVDERELSESGLELLDVGDLSAELSHVAEVIEMSGHLLLGCFEK